MCDRRQYGLFPEMSIKFLQDLGDSSTQSELVTVNLEVGREMSLLEVPN